MRIRQRPQAARYKKSVFRPRNKPSTYQRRQASRAYAAHMSRRQDTRTPRQRFTALVQAELDVRMQEQGWTVSRFIQESGIPRVTMYEWLKPDSERMPKVESVKRYAVKLGVPFEPYAEALGWTEAVDAPPKDLEGFIRRARALADHPRTSPERRRTLGARISAAEAAQRAAKEMEQTAEGLLRDALDDPEDANDR